MGEGFRTPLTSIHVSPLSLTQGALEVAVVDDDTVPSVLAVHPVHICLLDRGETGPLSRDLYVEH